MRRFELDYIDGLRALLALYIVVHHVFQFLGQFTTLGLAFFSYGQPVVAMFITVSGFCLALPQASSGQWTVNAGSFFRRRARRILPPYYAALALAILVNAGFQILGPFRDWVGEFSLAAVAAHALLIQNWSLRELYTLDGPLWSIALEVQIYLFFPLIILLRRRWNWYGLLAVATVFSCAMFRIFHFYGQVHFLLFFVFGVLSAELAFRHRHRWLTLGLIGSAALASVLIHHTSSPLQDTFASLACGGLLAYLSQEEHNSIRRALGWKPLAWIGTFSYSIYLLHDLFLQIAWYWSRDRQANFANQFTWSFVLFWLLISLIAIAGSYGFHVVFERPFMSSKRQKTEDRLAVV